MSKGRKCILAAEYLGDCACIEMGQTENKEKREPSKIVVPLYRLSLNKTSEDLPKEFESPS